MFWGTPTTYPHPNKVSAPRLRATPRHKQITPQSLLHCTGFKSTLFHLTQRTESNFTLLCEHKQRVRGRWCCLSVYYKKKTLHVASPREQPPAAACLSWSVRGSTNTSEVRRAPNADLHLLSLLREDQQQRVAEGTKPEKQQQPSRPPEPSLQPRNPPGEAKFLHQSQEKGRGEENKPEAMAQTGQARC